MDTANLTVSPDHLEIIKCEYEKCSEALTPTSRTMLARHLSETSGLQYKTALKVVDVYCEAQGVPVPEYLGREFNVGWLKVVSVLCIAVAIGACIYGRQLHFQQKYPATLWFGAALIGGIGIYSWVKSLEAEVDNNKKNLKPKT